jgi:protease IV
MSDDNMMNEPLPQPAMSSAAPARSASWERDTLEKLAFASLKEQQTTRRWKIFFRLALLSALLLIAYGLLKPNKGRAMESVGPHTALVELTGEISLEGAASADNINAALKSAFEDPESKGFGSGRHLCG